MVCYIHTGAFLGFLSHYELTTRAVRPHPLAVGGGGAKEVQLPRPQTLYADGAFSRGVIVWLLGVLGTENGHGHADVSSAQFLERRVDGFDVSLSARVLLKMMKSGQVSLP